MCQCSQPSSTRTCVRLYLSMRCQRRPRHVNDLTCQEPFHPLVTVVRANPLIADYNVSRRCKSAPSLLTCWQGTRMHDPVSGQLPKSPRLRLDQMVFASPLEGIAAIEAARSDILANARKSCRATSPTYLRQDSASTYAVSYGRWVALVSRAHCHNNPGTRASGPSARTLYREP
jgi:hypothetical protein